MQTSSPTPETHCNCEAHCDTVREEQSEAESLYALIAKQPFFKGLDEHHLKLLAGSAMRTAFETSHRIFQKGDPAGRFYIILKGGVVLESLDENGSVHRLQRLGPGDVLGWSWLFPPYYWHFDAVATEPTEAIFFYGTRLRAECEENHDLGYELMKRVSQIVIARLQTTRRRWVENK
jgi:CRP/FNR family transcriptional regulator, cyclic AMP receptor protein